MATLLDTKGPEMRTGTLKNGDKVRVRQSRFVTKLVRLSKKSFCEILDSKMGAEARKHEK